MSRNQFVVTLSLATFCGLLGGLLGVWLFLPQEVSAQSSDPSTQVITAGMFRVMDGNGKIRASFGVGPTGAAYLAINDEAAQLRTGLAVYKGNPSLVFYHKNADTSAGFPTRWMRDQGCGFTTTRTTCGPYWVVFLSVAAVAFPKAPPLWSSWMRRGISCRRCPKVVAFGAGLSPQTHHPFQGPEGRHSTNAVGTRRLPGPGWAQ